MDVTEPVVSPDTVEFDPFSDDFFNAPFDTYRRLRNEAPVYHNEKYGFWALSRYEDVEPALKDFETYSSARGSNAAVTFAANPEQWRKLHEDRSKIPGAFEELLRYEAPSQYQLRYSKRDVTLHETTIPSGSIVMLINGSATRDERAFADPIGSTSTRFRPGTTSISGTASIAALAPLSRGWRAGSRST